MIAVLPEDEPPGFAVGSALPAPGRRRPAGVGDTAVKKLRHAFRQLARAHGLTAVVVLTLAPSSRACTPEFTAIHQLAMRRPDSRVTNRIAGTAVVARLASPPLRVAAVREIASFADVRWKDVSHVPGLTRDVIVDLTFNKLTKWSTADAPVSRAVMERGRNPGLGIRALHAAGITGAGVSVGIVDQNLCGDHPEFTGRLVRYHDVGCNSSSGSMHGPAVASLLVGKSIGTAPGGRLYFAAAPSWTRDARSQAVALQWLLDINASLRPAEKIRVISVSAAPSGPGSNFDKNNADWDAACERAAKAGVLVLDCTSNRGIIGPCYYDPEAPDDLSRVAEGFPPMAPRVHPDRILAPCSRRTVAEEYTAGEYGYQYTGVGGLSWAIPYAAGVLALGWQVNPQLTPERAVALLRQTAYANGDARIINPPAFIEAVKATTKPTRGDERDATPRSPLPPENPE
jgi:hypothetical protein